MKPIAVHILTKEKYVSADKRYDVECKSSGSRPEAYITWWKAQQQLKRMAKNVSITDIAFVPFIRNNPTQYQFRPILTSNSVNK